MELFSKIVLIATCCCLGFIVFTTAIALLDMGINKTSFHKKCWWVPKVMDHIDVILKITVIINLVDVFIILS